MSGVLVTMRHVRAAGLCASGVRAWFDRRERPLFQRFCREGLPVEEVEAFGDHFATQIAAKAREEAARG